jgi:hypothetical protein
MSETLVVWVVLMIVAYGIVAVIAFVFLFKPYSLVRRQVAFYHRVYKMQAKMADEQIDRYAKPLMLWETLYPSPIGRGVKKLLSSIWQW